MSIGKVLQEDSLQQLAESPAQLKSLLDTMPDGVAVIRSRGEVAYLNSKVEGFIERAGSRSRDWLFSQLGQVGRAAIESKAIEKRPLRPGLSLVKSGGWRGELTVKVIPLLLNHEWIAVALLGNLETTPMPTVGSEAFHGLVGSHPSMQAVYDLIGDVGPLDVPVLILGESGTGKELVARALHAVSPRRQQRLIAMNCSALAEGVMESELFGHVRGAYSGAVKDRKGRFELADSGTLFLDEIGELNPSFQAKLLRVLQDGMFERVGDSRTIHVDARIICATNRNLENAIEAGRYRADLFYRISVITINLPPLRDRMGDIPALANHLIGKAAAHFNMQVPEIASSAMATLQAHRWPGNVRQLENVVRHALIRSGGSTVQSEHLPLSIRERGADLRQLAAKGQSRLSIKSVAQALEGASGNRTRAAKLLGVSRATLYRFLSECESLC